MLAAAVMSVIVSDDVFKRLGFVASSAVSLELERLSVPLTAASTRVGVVGDGEDALAVVVVASESSSASGLGSVADVPWNCFLVRCGDLQACEGVDPSPSA